MAEKLDVRRSLDSYRARRGQLRLVEVPDLQYLMVDGHGDPNTAVFTEAIESLYPVAYTLKFASKRAHGRDYVVPPLEGVWWAEDMAAFTAARDKSQWRWTLMILTPDWLDADDVASAARQAAAKNRASAKPTPARLADIRLETLSEGLCLQTLHVGSFDDEGDVLAQMHEQAVTEHGLQLTGRHHEIYLSDFRRTAPERRRTILRQPVAPA